MAAKNLKYQVGDQTICTDGEQFYTAKILRGEWWENRPDEDNGPHYFVHYLGWKSSHDEWVTEERLHDYSDVNLKYFKEVKQKLRKAAGTKQARMKELFSGAHSRPSLHQPPARSFMPQKSKSVVPVMSPKSKQALRRSLSLHSTSNGGSPGGPSSESHAKKSAKGSSEVVTIPMSKVLKGLLVSDWENVLNNGQLVPLPKKPSVADILFEYVGFRSQVAPREKRQQVTKGLGSYFNVTLHTLLLYGNEKAQFEDLEANHPGALPMDLYGAEHLLRLFVKLPELIAKDDMAGESKPFLRECLEDVARFLEANQARFFGSKTNAEAEFSQTTNEQDPREDSKEDQEDQEMKSEGKEEVDQGAKMEEEVGEQEERDTEAVTEEGSTMDFDSQWLGELNDLESPL